MTRETAIASDGRPRPVRTCIGCRRRDVVDELVRVTRADGVVRAGGPSDGRGAWLHRSGEGDAVDGDCLAAAIRRRGFERAWRCELDDDERAQLRALGARPGGRSDRGGAR